MWNVEGLKSLLRSSPMSDMFEKADIILVTESLVSDAAFSLPDFYAFIQPAPRAVMGAGLIIFSKPFLRPRLLSKSETHVAVQTNALTIIGFYFPPSTELDHVLLSVSEVISSVPDHAENLVVLGDFNCRLDSGHRGECLQEMLCEQFNLLLRNDPKCKTFRGPQGSSVIDLIFSSKRTSSEVNVVETLERRHCKLFACWPVEKEIVKTTNPKKSRNVDLDILKADESLTHVESLTESGAASAAASILSQAILSSCKIMKPRMRAHKPWFDETCRSLKQETLESRCTRFFASKKRAYKRVCNAKRIEWEEKELEKRIDDAEVKPWNLFGNRKSRSAAPIPLEEWEPHFEKLFNPDKAEPQIILPDSQSEDELEDEWYNEVFLPREIGSAIVSLKVKKAAGPDAVSNDSLKQTSGFLLPFWSLLLNSCLSFGIIPSQWRSSTLVTLFKGKGSNLEPGNYRGIALLCTMFKVMTKILNWRIMRHIAVLLPEEQYGFRPGRGTKDAIDILLHFGKGCLSKKKGRGYAGFVDFEKAFDSIDRAILISKMATKFKIKGLTLRLIARILQRNKICVFDGLSYSPEIKQHRGVLQGDSLSPTLFLMYIADLADELRKISNLKFLFYADDLVFYSESIDAIHEAFRTLSEWCQENRLKVNVKKTKVMKFRKAGRLALRDRFFFDNQPIDVCNAYDYLGIVLQPSLTFTKHVMHRKAKAVGATGSLKHLRNVSIMTAIKIFNLKIKPILLYGWRSIAPCLKLKHLIEADRVKSIFLKKALCLPLMSSATLSMELCGEKSLVEELIDEKTFEFPEDLIVEYKSALKARRKSFQNSPLQFGPAFHDTDWKNAKRKHRHVFTRVTAHGLHHLMCISKRFHKAPLTEVIEDSEDEEDDCVCRLCGGPFVGGLYHILSCPAFEEDLDLVHRAARVESS